jgi:hypothetical protein
MTDKKSNTAFKNGFLCFLFLPSTIRTRSCSSSNCNWRALALNGAAPGSRIRAQTPHLFDVDTENLGYAPGLSNASARAMGRVTFEDLRDMT